MQERRGCYNVSQEIKYILRLYNHHCCYMNINNIYLTFVCTLFSKTKLPVIFFVSNGEAINFNCNWIHQDTYLSDF